MKWYGITCTKVASRPLPKVQWVWEQRSQRTMSTGSGVVAVQDTSVRVSTTECGIGAACGGHGR